MKLIQGQIKLIENQLLQKRSRKKEVHHILIIQAPLIKVILQAAKPMVQLLIRASIKVNHTLRLLINPNTALKHILTIHQNRIVRHRIRVNQVISHIVHLRIKATQVIRNLRSRTVHHQEVQKAIQDQKHHTKVLHQVVGEPVVQVLLQKNLKKNKVSFFKYKGADLGLPFFFTYN